MTPRAYIATLNMIAILSTKDEKTREETFTYDAMLACVTQIEEKLNVTSETQGERP